MQKGFLPASTSKVSNSIIALETGTIESDSTLLKWGGESISSNKGIMLLITGAILKLAPQLAVLKYLLSWSYGQ